MGFVDNPFKEIARKIQQLRKETQVSPMDEQEKKEREEAAEKYFGEDERHYVDYCYDCIGTSVKASKPIREIQEECFSVYNEEEPSNYAAKEDWQSKVIVPKPFGAIQFALAKVRKAFSTEFFSIENEKKKENAEVWERLMKHQFNTKHANFPIRFTDATGMALAIGQSLEMIPVWRNGNGLDYLLVEPWKIHRDPDAISRHPQSGMYWIHQEYLDYHDLARKEKEGIYVDVERVKDQTSDQSKDNEYLDRHRLYKRKDMVWNRSHYRKMVLTNEFWGQILDKGGNMLLPNHTYTIAGRNIISPPKKSPYIRRKWPGISFSPFPHFLRYEGRGLLQGVRTLWYFMCSLLGLHNDNLNWIVNPMIEMDISGFINTDDIDIFPGKPFITRGTINGNQSVRTIDRRSTTTDVLANLQFCDQNFQRGTFVTDAVQGLPGYRKDMPYKMAAQNLSEGLDVFSNIAQNIEDGAILAVEAGAESVEMNIGVDELEEVFPREIIATFLDEESDTGVKLPMLDGSFHVSGITALIKDNDTLTALKELILPLTQEGTVFAPYILPYNVLKSIEARANLKDEGVIVEENEAQIIKENQKKQEQAMFAQQKEMIESQETLELQKSQVEMEKLGVEKQKLELEMEKIGLEILDTREGKAESGAKVEKIYTEIEKLEQEMESLKMKAATQAKVAAEKVVSNRLKTEANYQKIMSQIAENSNRLVETGKKEE